VAKVEKRTPTLSKERQRELLREMLLIRRFEEKVEERFRAGERSASAPRSRRAT
jgi:TPP-dependent pyruvate/acetoin dehydrogenase alpha subunit